LKPKVDDSLVRIASRRLTAGPAHTLDLARDVLGLEGHPGAASAAVFQLLGSDPRFQVDSEGIWSLDPILAPYGAPLLDVPFAVVDVETTGGASWRGHRIIDVSIVEVRGGRITDEYETLVNPGQAVPPGADEVRARLQGRVFVAYHATVDWGFVSSELVTAGQDAPDIPQLCTIRMARRLVPHLRRRNLDVLCRHFGVRIHARHRAHGDALATARVLLRMLDEAAGRGIEDFATLEWYLKRRRQRKRFDPEQFSLDLPGYSPRHNLS
jgi:DNA polymerase III epsilon subunit-like protein